MGMTGLVELIAEVMKVRNEIVMKFVTKWRQNVMQNNEQFVTKKSE